MPERVILGYRSDINQTAMWVSAPGKSARSTIKEDLLVDHEIYNNIYLMKGIITNPTLKNISRTDSIGAGTYCADLRWEGGGFVCYRWALENVVNPGVGTWEFTIPHNLGYTPRAHISVQADKPSTPIPQVFINSTNIVLRYYEALNGVVIDHVSYWGGDPAQLRPLYDMTFACTIHYSLFVRSI